MATRKWSKSKYGAQKTIVDGRTFASKLEAARYRELKALVASGEVLSFTIQPVFQLYAGIKYIADFRVYWADGTTTVEDAESVETDVFKLKKKLYEDMYGKLTVLTKKDIRQ